MFKTENLKLSFKLALSVVLFYWLALWMDWDMPKYGGMAIAVISLDTTGASLQKGLMRIAGSLGGLAVGLLILDALVQSRWGCLIFQAFFFCLVGYLGQRSRYQYAWFVAGYIPALVWAESLGRTEYAFHYATYRYLETIAGVLVYTLVSALIWPRNAGDQLNVQGRELWEGLRDLFRRYRKKIADAREPEGTPELRTRLAGNMQRLFTTLRAAYADTSRIRGKRRQWEVLRVNLRALGDALELWREGIGDWRGLDLDGLVPGLSPALETMDRRFLAIDKLWSNCFDPRHVLDAGDDSALLQPLCLELRVDAGEGLSRLDRAALLSSLRQWEILDRTSRELLRTLRVLAGLDSSRGFEDSGGPADLSVTAPWQPEMLAKALFPALCFTVGYFFWIYANPPGGPVVPVIAGVLSLGMMLMGFNPYKLVTWMLVIIWVVVAPIYFFVMPSLDTALGLFVLLFVYTFVFAVLGGRAPVLRFLPLLLLVLMVHIKNEQTYSFMGLVDGGMLFALGVACILPVQMLLPLRPEKIMLRRIRRFFGGCARIMDAFSIKSQGSRTRGRKRRVKYYQSMVLPLPAQLQAAEKALDYKLFPHNPPEKVHALTDNLQSIAYRVQAMEIAFDRLYERFPGLMEAKDPMGIGGGEPFRRVFEDWARLDGGNAMESRRSAFEKMAGEIRKLLDAREQSTRPDPAEDEALTEFYALLGSFWGLVQAMAEAQGAIQRIDWDEWAAARF